MNVADRSEHAIRSIVRLAFVATVIFAATFVLMTADTQDCDADSESGRTIPVGDYYYLVVSEKEKLVELKEVYVGVGNAITIPTYISDSMGTYTVIGVGENACKDVKFMTSIRLPTTATYIRDNAFIGCEKMSKIEGMDNISEIGAHAFSGCKSLETITVLADIDSIKEGTFEQCYQLKTVIFPSTVKRIENNAFQDCAALLEFKALENLTYIGDNAFAGCSQLKEIVIPDTVTQVGKNVYSGCTELVTVTISSSLTEITSGMFNNCTNLTNVSFTKSVTWIGSYAFSGCIHLSEITLASTVKFIGSFAFNGLTFYTLGETELITDYGDLPGYTYAHKSQSESEWDGTMIRQETYSVHYDPNGGPTITDDEPHTAGHYFLPTRFESGSLVCEDWEYDGKTYHYGDQIMMPGEDITLECIWTYVPEDTPVEPQKESNITTIIIVTACIAVVVILAAAVSLRLIMKRNRQ